MALRMIQEDIAPSIKNIVRVEDKCNIFLVSRENKPFNICIIIYIRLI